MADLKDDINKYLKGELTPAEMYALEKRALDDPFLADALEGGGQITPEQLENDLDSLHVGLQHRIAGKRGKVIPFWMWPARIAAGFLLIATATLLIISITQNQSSEDLAIRDERAPSASEKTKQDPAVTDTIENSEKDFLSLSKPDDAGSRAASPIAAPKAEEAHQDAIASPKESVQEEESRPLTEPKTDEVHSAAELILEDKVAQAVPPASQPQDALKKTDARSFTKRESEKARKSAAGAPAPGTSRDEAANLRIIRGQVIADDGSGLPGVNVMIKGTNIGTVTDASGNYQIAVPQEEQRLVFSFIGFMSTELDAAQQDQVDVQLSQDVSQLSEVVVVGYGTDGNSDDNLSTTMEMAAPEGGRKAFKQYLEKNLRYPEQAVNNKVEGRVTIQFTVESSGRLADFKVIKGIGNGCDEEVIRLIQQGPQWTPSKRNNEPFSDTVKVRVKFELPKK